LGPNPYRPPKSKSEVAKFLVKTIKMHQSFPKTNHKLAKMFLLRKVKRTKNRGTPTAHHGVVAVAVVIH
jgi:hypothetical protein